MLKAQSMPSIFASIATFQWTVVNAAFFNLFVFWFFVTALQWTAVNMLFGLFKFFGGLPITKPISAR